MKRILIVTDLHPIFMNKMEEIGVECTYRPGISKQETMEIISDFQGLVVRTQFPIDGELLKMATSLEFIGRAGAGLDNIDLDFTQDHKIICFNAPEGNRDAVAEHTLGLLLSLVNNLIKSDQEVRQGFWDREGNRGTEIMGKTMGIIGMGNTGTALSTKLQGFQMNLLGYDKYKEDFTQAWVKKVSLEELFFDSDIISLHIPLTVETKGWVNESFFRNFRKPIILLNTSRGEIVNTAHLVNAMEKGLVIGAGLDVLESEKFPETSYKTWFEDLIIQNKVILSPHVAGWTKESYFKISTVLAEKIRMHLSQNNK